MIFKPRQGNANRTGMLAAQRARAAQLDLIRLQRKLTEDEQAEADRLSGREHMRAWRALQRERELQIGASA